MLQVGSEGIDRDHCGSGQREWADAFHVGTLSHVK